jgi:hypothetical protein
MHRPRILLCTALLTCSIAAWDRVALPAPAGDLVARAAGQELTAERLAVMIGTSPLPPVRSNIAAAANLWMNYQLLAHACAHGETFENQKVIDDAMWWPILSARVRVFYERVRKAFPPPDTTSLEQKYAQGQFLAAQHILIMMPENGAGMSQQVRDSLRRRAEEIRREVTSANFDDMVIEYSQEPGGKERRGNLGVFPLGPNTGSMYPEFESAVRALKPGQISPVLVQTPIGYHIVRRNLLSEVRAQFIEQLASASENPRRDAYIAGLRSAYNVVIRRDAVAKIRAVAANPENAWNDKTVLATSKNGSFTAARLARWLSVVTKQAQLKEELTQEPDSIVLGRVGTMIEQEVIGAEAEKAGVGPDTAELRQIRDNFGSMLTMASKGLGVDPKSLDDSAKTTAGKERLAAARVEVVLDKLFASNGKDFVEIPTELAQALRNAYEWRLDPTGVDRAAERAKLLRIALDSLKGPGSRPVKK